MEKILGIHLDIPKTASKIILKAIKKSGIESPRYYNYVPHVTLYRCRFPASQYPKLLGQLSALKMRLCHTAISKITSQPQENGASFLSLTLSRAVQIKKLHHQVLRPANQLRGKLIREKEKQLLRQNKFTKQESQYLHQYGSQRVLSLYKPHITLGEVTLQTAKSTIRKFTPFLNKLKKNPLNLSTLVVGLYNYDGRKETYMKVIREKEISLSR